MPPKTKLVHEMDLISNAALVCAFSRDLYMPSLKKRWWADDALRIKRMRMGIGLVLRVGARPEWIRVRLYKGVAPRAENVASVISRAQPIVCPAEFLDDWNRVAHPRKTDPVKHVNFNKGEFRYTALTSDASIDIYFEKIAREPSPRIDNGLTQTPMPSCPRTPPTSPKRNRFSE